MKFLNLNTGYSFDALWTENQEKGYIFWFPNEQSICLTYTMPIALVTDTDDSITLNIENNNIFSFINSSNIETTIDGYKFDGQPVYSSTITTEPEKISDNKYVHVFNVACMSNDAGEYVCKINIGNDGYIRVGADFYGEHEPAYINLSNMGVELPTTIQKAIYDANVHEDLTDNILINRKFKELLSNYWDVIANKGSYKSLLNSLKWFEWNEHIQLREIYKHYEADKTIFSDKDLVTTINEFIEETFSNTVKTAYISLYSDLYRELPEYDSEKNPMLQEVVFKYSLNDIKLKLSLLAKFFGLYFLPIHISILHATVESKVFTNTIKTIYGGGINRIDQFAEYTYINSNINDNAIFNLSNVKAQVADDTIFGVRYPDTNIFGVDIFGVDILSSEDGTETIPIRYYTGPGAIIPVKLVIPNVGSTDFIKQTIIEYTDDTNVYRQLYFYNVFSPENNEIHIDFNFLAKAAKKYNISMTFVFGSSKTISKQISFEVEDIDNLNINIYKVQAKKDITDTKNGFDINDFYSEGCNKYFFRIQPHTNDLSTQYYANYLPYLGTSYWNDKNYTGIKLNKTIVAEFVAGTCIVDTDKYNTDNTPSISITALQDTINMLGSSVTDNFLYFIKEKQYTFNDNETHSSVKSKKATYITFVSKYFLDNYTKTDEDGGIIKGNRTNELIQKLNNIIVCSKPKQPDSLELDYFITTIGSMPPSTTGAKKDQDLFKIIRNDYGFYPQFHETKKIEGNTIEDYTVKPYEAICAAAEISTGSEVIPFRYGHMIDSAEWTFYNSLTDETIAHPASSRQPFVADNAKVLRPGYYDIKFRYSLNNGTTQECKLNSAFRIK
jgi:hypothetical protein